METSTSMRVIKQKRSRTVFAAETNGTRIVIKRFHHPGFLQTLRDGLRARAEHRALIALSERGVDVPAPLGIQRTPEGFEVRMQSIDGAVTAEALLSPTAEPHRFVDLTRRGAGDDPAVHADFASRLGRLLASLHASGVDHPDLHLGNVLVDPSGRPWLIDFHSARIRKRPIGSARRERDVVALLAFLREAIDASERTRLLDAWSSALRERRTDEKSEEPLDVAAIEIAARAHRREYLAHGAWRWLRESSRCHVISGAPKKGGRPTRLEAKLPSLIVPPVSDGEPAPLTLSLDLPDDDARKRWLAAARLVDHRIPVACPSRFESTGESAHLVFELRTRVESPSAVEALGTLLGLLHDRGLHIRGMSPDALVRVGETGFALPPPHDLLAVDPLSETTMHFEGVNVDTTDGAFRAAYLAVFADRPDEARRVTQLTE